MKFGEYIKSAWFNHAKDPRSVADNIKSNFNLMETDEDIMKMAHLIVHVCGEHLGDWLLGLELIKKLKNNAPIKDKEAMSRYKAILELGNNPQFAINHFSNSDQSQILATTASALANLGGLKNAEKFLNMSSELLPQLPSGDPAFRSLAITGHNVAGALLELEHLSPAQIQLMIRSAVISRTNWELAGTWLEVERAEYHLAKVFFKAEKYQDGLTHAKLCREIIVKNGDVPLEKFFACEVLALGHKSLKENADFEMARNEMKATFPSLSIEDQAWCQESLDKLFA